MKEMGSGKGRELGVRIYERCGLSFVARFLFSLFLNGSDGLLVGVCAGEFERLFLSSFLGGKANFLKCLFIFSLLCYHHSDDCPSLFLASLKFICLSKTIVFSSLTTVVFFRSALSFYFFFLSCGIKTVILNSPTTDRVRIPTGKGKARYYEVYV